MTEYLSPKNVRAALEARAWTGDELARRAGIDKDTVYRILRHGRCSTKTFRKIVDAFSQVPENEVAVALRSADRMP